MFDISSPSGGPPGEPLCTEALAAVVEQLRDHGCSGSDDAERISQIRLLETLKNVASAVQAELTAAFAASREADLARVATPSVRDRARRDIGAQVGLARRVSPRLGSRLAGLATVLTAEMPHLRNALRRGCLDEYQALLVAGETAFLTREHRAAVDAELAGRYGSMAPREARSAAAGIGYRLDPEQAVRRARRAASDRRVTLRPAPDSMTYLTALLPLTEGAGVYAALTRHAATRTAAGDPRGRGALMADELAARLLRPHTAGHSVEPPENGCSGGDLETTSTQTGPPATEVAGNSPGLTDGLTEGLPGVPPGVGIEIHLIMTDRTLFDGDMEPAVLIGHGPVPAPLARHLIRRADPRVRSWVRRLYTDPVTGALAGGDGRRRRFGLAARQFLVARDQVCRTPWCAAPIRHADHVRPHASDGPTQIGNGAGLCAGCNQVKEQPDWSSTPTSDGAIRVTTPTGHSYLSRPPEPPRSASWPQSEILVA